MRFDRVIVVDWSAANLPTSPTNRANAIWIGCHDAEGGIEWHHRTRAAAEAQIRTLIQTAQADGLRLLVGCDFAMGYPAGFATRLTGEPVAQAVWRWLAQAITDTPDNRNNRFEVASRINSTFLEGPGPFWSHPTGQHYPDLPYRRLGIDYVTLGLAPARVAETAVPRAKSPWMLFNPGSVGSQSLLGLPMIHRLSQLPGVAVWPFDHPTASIVIAEVYPSLLAGPVAILANAENLPADQAQVRLLARALFALSRHDRLTPLFDTPAEATEEGWILGAGQAPLLAEALAWA
ncbi:molybdopterin guanine dinucleotide synthesis [Tabrizicola sp.]|uniref:molybdopterin guanine dinucleotide synthesis n=1 Tax=Tabrizicola sp. TaxID=2005166 RepID=UPI003F38765D